MRLDAKLICPHCGQESEHTMPTDACVQALPCPACGQVIRKKAGTCCVFCSHADRRCPPEQGAALK